MRVVVKLFASYKEKAGTGHFDLEMSNGATVGDLTAEVVRRYPSITRDPSRLVVAVNDEFQESDFALTDGDEAALIPPVSGGKS